MTVWIEGATGKVGRRVVAALATAGIPVRAASRHPGEPSPGVTPVRFDWYDPTTWSGALGDADTLFLKGLDSDDDNSGDMFARLLDSAPNARRVVLMTAMGVDRSPVDAPRHVLERVVRNSGKAWTILRPNWLMQNFDEDEWVYARAIREENELYAGSGDRVVSFVDTRDVADATVTVLTEDGHDGQGYTLTGPEAVTFGEVAEVLSRASGRPIRHVDADLTAHRAHFARSGRPDAWVDHMMHLFVLVRAGVFSAVTDDFRRLTGNPPRTLEAYAKEAFGR
ncbi:NAD(P)H-binding protein [Micromonospora sp. NPDC049559]|uniref:NAD(P)H-binding protein n=1 Tax=Micromonospora sp. NPDC049559 TaxID=3155923 RepID=UPI00343D8B24